MDWDENFSGEGQALDSKAAGFSDDSGKGASTNLA